MKKFWIEWLDGSLITSVEAESERSAYNYACNASTGLGLDLGTFRVREAA